MSNQQIILVRRPKGYPRAEHFALSEGTMPTCKNGEVLIKNLFVSADPAMRGWVSDEKNYLKPVGINSVMRSIAVGEVIESQHPDYSEGELVTGWFGWQQYAAVTPDQIFRKVTECGGSNLIPVSASLGVLGLNGITAYLALNQIGQPKAGETILISTAAGAVGSIAGQLAKQAGCRVLGITGSDEKVAQCLSDFGYDAAINYKQDGNLERSITELCNGNSIDIFFDQTSGSISDAVWPHMNLNGRIIQCGTSAIDSWSPKPQAPRRERDFITKRLLQQGFVVFDHMEKWPAVAEVLAALIRQKQLQYKEHKYQGLNKAPTALENLYLGNNTGKSVIQINHFNN